MDLFLFVYGTMLRGHKNHWRIEGFDFIGEGKVPGILYHRGGSPGMKEFPFNGKCSFVHGEIYLIPEHALYMIDAYEGYASKRASCFNTYVRKRREIIMPNGKRCSCFLYLYNKSIAGLPIIPDGKYTELEGEVLCISEYEKRAAVWK